MASCTSSTCSAPAIGMLGLNLPGTTASRAIVCRLWPKLPTEQVAEFRHIDDDDFTALRRKALRWAADSAAALRDADPVMPSGFGNRVAANYRLLLAIADQAGGVWPRTCSCGELVTQAAATLRASQTACRPTSAVIHARADYFGRAGRTADRPPGRRMG